jgi:hypothetical protein
MSISAVIAEHQERTKALSRQINICRHVISLFATVGYRKQNIGMAGLIERAPAGQILTAKLGSNTCFVWLSPNIASDLSAV